MPKTGLSEVFKIVFSFNSKLAPVVMVVLGLAASLGLNYYGGTKTFVVVVQGLAVGLSAVGIYIGIDRRIDIVALVTGITRKVEIPHEPGEWMELRRLSWRQLEAAAEVQTDILFKRIKKMGSDIISAFQSTAKGQETDPYTQYDRETVLQAGILKWSYDAEVNKASIDLLDEETAEWAFQEILSLNKPRTEDEQKNA